MTMNLKKFLLCSTGKSEGGHSVDDKNSCFYVTHGEVLKFKQLIILESDDIWKRNLNKANFKMWI